MARNVEIKARIDQVATLEPRVAAIATEGPLQISQDDTFFHCDQGRLKLRALSETYGELIFYQRSNESGPKECFYVQSQTNEPTSLREALTLAYGQVGRVRKQRTLYLVGRTRVHLDVVEDLGHFLELEVVLAEEESIAAGVTIAHHLMAELGITTQQLIDKSYVDLLNEQHD